MAFPIFQKQIDQIFSELEKFGDWKNTNNKGKS